MRSSTSPVELSETICGEEIDLSKSVVYPFHNNSHKRELVRELQDRNYEINSILADLQASQEKFGAD